jgi:hypothetical protein
VLSEERRQWKRERALIEAEAQKTIAELKAPLPSLIDNHLEQVKERSACVKTEAMARGHRRRKDAQAGFLRLILTVSANQTAEFSARSRLRSSNDDMRKGTFALQLVGQRPKFSHRHCGHVIHFERRRRRHRGVTALELRHDRRAPLRLRLPRAPVRLPRPKIAAA